MLIIFVKASSYRPGGVVLRYRRPRHRYYITFGSTVLLSYVRRGFANSQVTFPAHHQLVFLSEDDVRSFDVTPDNCSRQPGNSVSRLSTSTYT